MSHKKNQDMNWANNGSSGNICKRFIAKLDEQEIQNLNMVIHKNLASTVTLTFNGGIGMMRVCKSLKDDWSVLVTLYKPDPLDPKYKIWY